MRIGYQKPRYRAHRRKNAIPPRHWTTAEIEKLKELFGMKLSLEKIGKELGRTRKSVARKLESVGFRVRRARYTPENADVPRTPLAIRCRRCRLKKQVQHEE